MKHGHIFYLFFNWWRKSSDSLCGVQYREILTCTREVPRASSAHQKTLTNRTRCWEVTWDQSKWLLHRVGPQPMTPKQGRAGPSSTANYSIWGTFAFQKIPENISPSVIFCLFPMFLWDEWSYDVPSQHGLHDLNITEFPKSGLWTKTMTLPIAQLGQW